MADTSDIVLFVITNIDSIEIIHFYGPKREGKYYIRPNDIATVFCSSRRFATTITTPNSKDSIAKHGNFSTYHWLEQRSVMRLNALILTFED